LKSILNGFDATRGTLLLFAESQEYCDESIKEYFLARGFSLKNEHHVTIVGNSSGKEISNFWESLSPSSRIRAITGFRHLVCSFDWNFSLLDEYFRLIKDYSSSDISDKRETIIRLIDLPCLEEFYRKLNRMFSFTIPLPVPVAHITLFAKGTHFKNYLQGIGVRSKEQLEKVTVEKLAFNGE